MLDIYSVQKKNRLSEKYKMGQWPLAFMYLPGQIIHVK